MAAVSPTLFLAAIYYCQIRMRKPATVLEVGCGSSTFAARDAVRRNGVGRVVAIDPQPRTSLDGSSGIEFIKRKVEDTPMSVFLGLKAGDVFFFDTWHTLKVDGDVRYVGGTGLVVVVVCILLPILAPSYVFMDVLPRIARGVLCHVHDIHAPIAIQPVGFSALFSRAPSVAVFFWFAPLQGPISPSSLLFL